MDHITEHYYTTHPDVNPHGIVARGPDLEFENPMTATSFRAGRRPTSSRPRAPTTNEGSSSRRKRRR